MTDPIRRREFLKRALSAGTVAAGIPLVLAGESALALGRSKGSGGHFETFGVGPERLRKVLARALARGGDFAEVFLQHQVEHWIAMEDGAVNRAYTTVSLGAGIRVLKGDATGFSFCESLDEAALLAAAATAAAVADGTPALRPKALAAVSVPSRYRMQVPFDTVGVPDKLKVLERADARARAADRRVVKVRLSMADESGHILVADSDGRRVEDHQPMATLNVSCVAEAGGKTESSYASRSARAGMEFFTPALIDGVADEATAFTVLLFDAVSPPAGEYPVVLAPGISGILLHEAMGHGMEADFNRKGISIYSGRIGQKVAPDFVTILDDGTNPDLRGSINVDDEGEPGRRTVLVENGVLRSYLHDRISAAHFHVDRTGSGRRESFRFPPVPRMRNTSMAAGPHKPEEVLAGVKKGLYAELFMNGQVQIGAGDFTFYLKHGRLIEDGKLTRYVKDANLIGNGPKVLENVRMVADDVRFHCGAGYCGKDGQRVPVGFGLPTTCVGAISIGGRGA